MHNLEATVRIIANNHFLAGQGPRNVGRIEDEQHLVAAQRHSLRQRANFLAAHGAIKVLVIGPRPVHVLRIARLFAETRVEIRNELRCIGVGFLDSVNTAKPHLLDQPILQCLVGTFHPALGLRGVGADDVDVQLIKRPAELRQAPRAVLLRRMRGAENTMLVTVEGQRFAPLLQIGLGRVQIVECVLRSVKP